VRAEEQFLVIDRSELAGSELQGRDFGGANVCLIFFDGGPGEGPKLHRHAYEEVFIILEGRARFTIGSTALEASAGQVLLVRAGVPHKFTNLSTERLRQIDIHLSPQFVTEWLEA